VWRVTQCDFKWQVTLRICASVSLCVACRAVDLKKVTELFTRMFYDPQSKVLSVFIETIVDFVAVHSEDLVAWLPILLPRLFLRLTADLRGSIHTKVQQALQAVRCFSCYQCLN